MGAKVLKVLRDYSILTVGVIIFAIAWGCFVIPNGLTAGGLTGFCVIINMATGGTIPVSYLYAGINVLLLIVGFLIMGQGFGFKTIYCIALSSLLLNFFEGCESVWAVEGNILFVQERLLIPIIGGLLEAIGLAMVFNRGGSTGGTDIIALIVNKYWPVSPGKIFIYVDLVIIASILLIPGKTFSDMIYGYIMMITFSVMLDFILMGRQSSVKLLIFSDKYEEIADHIIKDLDRGVTVVKSLGWYTKQDKSLLLIIVRSRQLREIRELVKSIDPQAFMSVSKTSGVYGEGFEEIKTGFKKKKKK